MVLPEGFENRRLAEWNYLVCGLMEVWEIARLRGAEQELEDQLRRDRTGVLTELLGGLGHIYAVAGDKGPQNTGGSTPPAAPAVDFAFHYAINRSEEAMERPKSTQAWPGIPGPAYV